MIYTIGHSNHEVTYFIELLRQHDITMVCDVRSHPYSRHVPQFSRDALTASLAEAGIAYVFLGKKLGARSENPTCYRNGKVRFDCLAEEAAFSEGLERVAKGAESHRIALMCTEKDPLECHRALLVARKLVEAGFPVSHIQADGSLESHDEMELRMLTRCKLPEGDLFNDRSVFIAQAYEIQSERVAYQRDDIDESGRRAVS